jgi:hypothetical protein
MRTNMKVILAAVGAAALLASPVMAKTRHVQAQSAEQANVLESAAARRVYSAPRPANEGGAYTPSIPSPLHGQSRDFQDDERGN